jgi:hypothetical protein
MAETRTVYLVQRDGCVPVEVLTRREDAERRCRELEREAREHVPPFHSYHVRDMTSLTPPELCRRVRELGLPSLPNPPADPGYHFQWDSPLYEWFKRHVDAMTAEQREGFLGLFDKWRFYDVVPMELEG